MQWNQFRFSTKHNIPLEPQFPPPTKNNSCMPSMPMFEVATSCDVIAILMEFVRAKRQCTSLCACSEVKELLDHMGNEDADLKDKTDFVPKFSDFQFCLDEKKHRKQSCF